MKLLDTHTWIWYVSTPGRLSPTSRQALDEDVALGKRLLVSSISIWEVALLHSKDRVELNTSIEDWVARAEAVPFLRFVPVDNRVALRSVLLPPPLHQDPADRILAATAQIYGAVLVTADARLRNYPEIQTLW